MFPFEKSDVRILDDLFVQHDSTKWEHIETFAHINDEIEQKCSVYASRIVRHTCTSDIFLRVYCPNVAYITSCVLTLGDEKKYAIDSADDIIQKIPLYPHTPKSEYYLRFKFSCPNFKLPDVQPIELVFSLVTRFDTAPVELGVVIDPRLIEKGMREKEIKIMKMPVDLLYLHAVMYADTFRTNENPAFRQRAAEILSIFDKLEKTWKIAGTESKYKSDDLKGLLYDCLLNSSARQREEAQGVLTIHEVFNPAHYPQFCNIAEYLNCKTMARDGESFVYGLIPTIHKIKKRLSSKW